MIFHAVVAGVRRGGRGTPNLLASGRRCGVVLGGSASLDRQLAVHDGADQSDDRPPPTCPRERSDADPVSMTTQQLTPAVASAKLTPPSPTQAPRADIYRPDPPLRSGCSGPWGQVATEEVLPATFRHDGFAQQRLQFRDPPHYAGRGRRFRSASTQHLG